MISVVLLMSIQVFLPTSYAQSSGDALAQALSAYGLKNPTVVIVRNSAEIIFITKTSFFRPLNEPALRVKFIYRQVCMYNSLVKLQIGTSYSSISMGTIKREFRGKLV